MNEEHFRLYALWTFVISSLYVIIYLILYLDQYRTFLFIALGLILLGLIAYWFRDGGVKQGWDRLNEGIFIMLVITLANCMLMIIAAFVAFTLIHTLPESPARTISNVISYSYRISPIVVTVVNVANLLIFLARN